MTARIRRCARCERPGLTAKDFYPNLRIIYCKLCTQASTRAMDWAKTDLAQKYDVEYDALRQDYLATFIEDIKAGRRHRNRWLQRAVDRQKSISEKSA